MKIGAGHFIICEVVRAIGMRSLSALVFGFWDIGTLDVFHLTGILD